ncbi:MAG TPA: hypothetical protein VK203_11850 [Nostocaceae cyanobacterium]|nr:hypothetical protein [Nostocaceae cyanobacterium]
MIYHRALQTWGLFACHCKVINHEILVGILVFDTEEQVPDLVKLVDPEDTQKSYCVLLPEYLEPVTYNIKIPIYDSTSSLEESTLIS